MIPIEQVKEIPALWAGGVRPSDKLMDNLLRHYYELRLRTEWIHIREGFPTDNQQVLLTLVAPNNTREVWEGYREGKYWYSPNGDLIIYEVTHWMPLPELPEVGA